MALAARRLHEARRQERLFPCQRAAVGFLDGSGSALSAMTHDAAELINVVRVHGMPAKRLQADVRQAGFFHSNVASGAAIDDPQFRKPDLLNSVVEMPLEGYGVSTFPNQREILLLIMSPFTEMILGGGDGERNQ